jgi:hypothetical protein
MHENDPGSTLRRQRQHRAIFFTRGDVIDRVRPGIECRLRDFCQRGINRNRNLWQSCTDRPNRGHDACDLFRRGDTRRARTR